MVVCGVIPYAIFFLQVDPGSGSRQNTEHLFGTSCENGELHVTGRFREAHEKGFEAATAVYKLGQRVHTYEQMNSSYLLPQHSSQSTLVIRDNPLFSKHTRGTPYQALRINKCVITCPHCII